MGLLSLHTLVTGILKHFKYIFKYNLLGFLGVQFVAPSSAELAAGAGGDKNAFKSNQVGSNWLKLRFETYYKHL